MNQRMRSSTATLVSPEHTVPPVLHGADPLRGHPVTWHFTPASSPDIDGPAWLVERVDGTMSNPDVWMQARKETVVLAMSDVLDLIRAVHARSGNAA